MKLVITGGHLSPALSVIEELPKDTNILVIGRKYVFEGDKAVSFEYKVLAELGIPFVSIDAGRIQRKFTKYTLKSLLKVPIGFFQALKIVSGFKPDLVLSLGGYVSFPVILAAAFFRTPIIIHEQTLSAGLANRIAAFLAKKVCISWESSRKYFPASKTVLTGIPIRKFRVKGKGFRVHRGKEPLIYITGGSSGSHFVNILVQKILKRLLEDFRIIHQTGESFEYNDFDRLQRFRETLDNKVQKKYRLVKFINPSYVGAILEQSSFIIGRSGINTMTEILMFEKPAILIPLNNEQTENARFLEKLGLAKVLTGEQADGASLYNLVQSMMRGVLFNQKHKDERLLVEKDAAGRIVDLIQNELARKKNSP